MWTIVAWVAVVVGILCIAKLPADSVGTSEQRERARQTETRSNDDGEGFDLSDWIEDLGDGKKTVTLSR